MPLPPESKLQPPPGRGPNLLALGLVLIATVFTVAAVLLYEHSRTGEQRILEVRVQAPEKGNFYPLVLHAAPGERVWLRVRNVDTVSHGFTIPALNIGITELKPGETVPLEITLPTQAGTYDFFCTVWCSKDHMKMRGRLVASLEPPGP
jgi:plastocyanin